VSKTPVINLSLGLTPVVNISLVSTTLVVNLAPVLTTLVMNTGNNLSLPLPLKTYKVEKHVLRLHPSQMAFKQNMKKKKPAKVFLF